MKLSVLFPSNMCLEMERKLYLYITTTNSSLRYRKKEVLDRNGTDTRASRLLLFLWLCCSQPFIGTFFVQLFVVGCLFSAVLSFEVDCVQIGYCNFEHALCLLWVWPFVNTFCFHGNHNRAVSSFCSRFVLCTNTNLGFVYSQRLLL